MKKLHLKINNCYSRIKQKNLRTNKKICFLFFLNFLLITTSSQLARGTELKDTISISLKNNILLEAFDIISKESGYSFAFSKEFIPEDLKLTKEFINSSVNDILASILRGTGITFKIVDEQIILTKKKTLNKYTISGYLTDKETGEALFQATVSDKNNGHGCVSNENGFYSIILPEGIYTISYSYIGSNPEEQIIILDRDVESSVQLEPNIELDEVIVVGNDKQEIIKRTDPLGKLNISNNSIESMPVVMAEPDILKSVQLIPGIQGGAEGTGEIYVRGGGPLQNLFLLDNVPIYNCFHLLGLFSVFNSDIIGSTDVIKGGFPAKYGGRLSSVVDIKTKDGNMKELNGKISLGLISSKLFLEGPLFKDKTSFVISGRMGYYYIYGKFLPQEIGSSNNINNYNFKDINVKLTHKLSENQKLYFSFYTGDDTGEVLNQDEETIFNTYSFYKDIDGQNWKNLIGTIGWTGKISNKIFGNIQVATSQYNYSGYVQDSSYNMSQTDTSYYFNRADLKNSISNYFGLADIQYKISPLLNLKLGYKYTLLNLGSKNTKTSNYKDSYAYSLNSRKDTILAEYNYKTHEHTGFLELQIEPWHNFQINPGVHLSYYENEKYNSISIEPRISGSWEFTNNIILKASYTRMSQHIHLLGATRIKQASDLIVAATEKAPSEKSDQYSLGISYLRLKNINIHVDAYYKSLSNLINFSEGASYFKDSPNWEDKIEVGTGDSKGLEFLIQKSEGKISGWIGYTYSKTTRKFNGINSGNSFPFIYDQRHYFNIVGKYSFNKNFDVSFNWLFHTGSTSTIPAAIYYTYSDYFYGRMSNTYGSNIAYYNEKNTYRLPSYHRLDISLNYKRINKLGQEKWTLSVYNVYNRKNVYIANYREDYTYIIGGLGYTRREVDEKNLFGIIPSLSYTLSF